MGYAVIRTGGKQYRVSPGDLLHIERLTGEVGSPVEFAEVLLTANDGAVVELSGVPGKAQSRAEVIVIPINPVGENPGRLRSWVEHVRLG